MKIIQEIILVDKNFRFLGTFAILEVLPYKTISLLVALAFVML